MKIKLLFTGKTDTHYLEEGISDYLSRLKQYTRVEVHEVKIPRQWNALPADQRKEREGQLILKHLVAGDECILLDERGRSFSSVKFAAFLAEKMQRGTKTLAFVVGGPWGFSPALYHKASMQLSLSSMTFSHQMVRLFFTEQLYRAYTILRGEPYHHG